jgi:hypothetical protein
MEIMHDYSMKPRAWVVNLDRRPDRWTDMQRKWSDVFDMERVSAVDGAARNLRPDLCCKMTHFLLFDTLKKVGPEVRWFPILEDDVLPTEAWSTLWPQICAWLDADTDQQWDFITMDPFLQFDAHNARPYSSLFAEIDKFRSTGFIIYSRRFIERFDRKAEPIVGAIDMTFTHSPRWKKLTPVRLCARQEPESFSDINCRVNTHRTEFWDNTEKILRATVGEPSTSGC